MTGQCIPHYISVFAPLLYEFTESKRLEGYKYNGEVKELQRLDRYLQSLSLSGPAVESAQINDWLAHRASESDKTFSTRNSVYRQLFQYASTHGDVLLPKPPRAREKIHSSGFVPYIFTHDEIHRLFAAIDEDASASVVFQRCWPTLFRVLYGTGVRINEALSLIVDDIDFDRQLIIIRQAKNDNSRLVPMAPSLANRLDSYLCINSYRSKDALFQSSSGNAVRKNAAYDWFRRSLWKAGIPHRGRNFGPRLHDIRHTFAVHSLQHAIEMGQDINAFLPVLSTYLGHSSLAATERYLRLTAEAFPSVINEVDTVMKDIIPEVTDYE